MARNGRFRMIAVAAAAVAASAVGVGAQMPGAPVLQNAFVAPGMVFAVDGGGGDGAVYAGAVSWAPGNARFQLSGGVGSWTPTGGSGRLVYGARLAAPLFSMMGGNLGLGVFAGAGSGPARGTTPRAPTQVPVGASIGYRKTLGATHGISLYAAPMYLGVAAQGQSSEHLFRTSFGVDVGVTSSIGVTAGVETGQTSTRGGPTSSRWGVAVSWAPGRR